MGQLTIQRERAVTHSFLHASETDPADCPAFRGCVRGWRIRDFTRHRLEERVDVQLAKRALKEKGTIPWARAKKTLGIG